MKKAILIGLVIVTIALTGCIQEEGPKWIETSEFEVIAPEGWEVDTSPASPFLIEFIGPEEDEIRASITVTEAVEVESVEDVIEFERSQLIADGFEIMREREYLTWGSMVSNRDAHYFYTSYTEQGSEMAAVIVIVSHWSKNKTIRFITFSTLKSSVSKNERAFLDLTGRFKWYD